METLFDTEPPLDEENDTYRVSVTLCLKRCGFETWMVIDNGDPPPAHHRSKLPRLEAALEAEGKKLVIGIEAHA